MVVRDEKALGRAIQDARQKAGMTQQQLCERVNISYSTLTKIERGAIKSPSVFTVQQIAECCGVSIEYLLGTAPLSMSAAHPLVAAKKVAQNGVKFVYFDINGCLVRFFQRAFTELSEKSGVRPETIENTFWHYNDAVCRGEMSMAEFNRILGDKIGVKDLDWSTYYLRNIDPVVEMAQCVAWVSQHFKIGLLSNIMPGFIRAMIDNDQLPKVAYDCIIDSSVVGAIKPEQRMYDIAAEHAGVAPHEILLVDDSRANLMAAEHLGWHVLWFDDYRPDESIQRITSTLEY